MMKNIFGVLLLLWLSGCMQANPGKSIDGSEDGSQAALSDWSLQMEEGTFKRERRIAPTTEIPKPKFASLGPATSKTQTVPANNAKQAQENDRTARVQPEPSIDEDTLEPLDADDTEDASSTRFHDNGPENSPVVVKRMSVFTPEEKSPNSKREPGGPLTRSRAPKKVETKNVETTPKAEAKAAPNVGPKVETKPETKSEEKVGVQMEISPDSKGSVKFDVRRNPAPEKKPVVTDEAPNKAPTHARGHTLAAPDGREIVEKGIVTPTVYFIAIVNEDAPSCEPNEMVSLHGLNGKPLVKVCPRTRGFCAQQGSCIIKRDNKWTTYNVVKSNRYAVVTDECIYGYGVKGICLDPFYSVAADMDIYDEGDVIFLPALRGQILPNGQRHDGYLIVRDRGHGVKGKGRFDFFTGSMNWKHAANPFVRLRLNDRTTDLDYQKVSGGLAQRVRLKRGYPKLPTKGLVEMALASGNTAGVPTTPL